MLLRSSFGDSKVDYATTIAGLAERSNLPPATIIPDFNAHKPFKTVFGAAVVAWMVLRSPATVIVSTGAAPGLIALMVGRVTGRRTIWIDSIANPERLSLCGRLAGRFADLWLTQWEHLAKPGGPMFAGAVL